MHIEIYFSFKNNMDFNSVIRNLFCNLISQVVYEIFTILQQIENKIEKESLRRQGEKKRICWGR